MCIAIDASKSAAFANGAADMLPISKWLQNSGKIVYSDHPQIKKEIQRGEFREQLLQYDRKGKATEIAAETVQSCLDEIRRQHKSGRYRMKSNTEDHAMVALCMAKNVKVLVSGDKKLHEDYKRHVPQGKIYQTVAHAHLLTPDTCP